MGRLRGRVFARVGRWIVCIFLRSILCRILRSILFSGRFLALFFAAHGGHAFEQLVIIFTEVAGQRLGSGGGHFEQARFHGQVDLIPAQQVQLDLQATRQLQVGAANPGNS